jgi:hypothetical protein
MKRNDAERFLRDLANSPDQFLSHYREMFTGDADPEATATVLRQLLRRAWDARDYRRREWYCHEMAAYFHRLRPDRDLKESLGTAMAKGTLGDFLEPGSLLFSLREPPRRPSALEAALLYFKKNITHARHCRNRECPAPYYFARKKNQKYCSPVCALPAQRASKRKWWHENRQK